MIRNKLPENKKANTWHGSGKFVAYGRLPSPARTALYKTLDKTKTLDKKGISQKYLQEKTQFAQLIVQTW